MYYLLCILGTGLLCITSFLIGRSGQVVITNGSVENTTKVKKTKKNKDGDEEPLDPYTAALLENIENYNGTDIGQKSLPKRE
jgi:hypothetical protein